MVEKYEIKTKVKNPYLRNLIEKISKKKSEEKKGGVVEQKNGGQKNVVNINDIIQKADELSMIIKNIRFKQPLLKPENYIKDKNGKILLEIKEKDQNNVM